MYIQIKHISDLVCKSDLTILLYDMDDKHIIGELCKRGHKQNGQECSLRYKSTHQCIECMNERRAATREKYRDIGKQSSRRWYNRHRDKRLQEMSSYRSTDAFKQSRKRNATKYKTKHLERVRIWRETPRGKLIVSENNRKRRQTVKDAPRLAYTVDELLSRFNGFNGCAYCGQVAGTVDHFVPLAKGGWEALHNLLPACRKCNVSKRDSEAETWYRSQPFFCLDRWNKIQSLCTSKLSP